tara:strand:- start:731 stop:1438 length:708 start_codon:yes stop_codon:yes gene_type:complete
MGLKELKSNLDTVGTFGGAPGQTSTNQSTIPGSSVNNAAPDPLFNTLNGTSDSPFNGKSGDHMVDLLTIQASSTNTGETYQPSPNKSPFQDLDGVQGPQFQRPLDVASRAHVISLSDVPGGTENSPYQDLDGVQGPQFQRETVIASQVHESSLALVPGGDQNSDYQDLDGFSNNPSFGDAGGAGKQLSNKDLHESLLTEQYQYSHNTPVVTINAGAKDLNGSLPANGEYISNLPG